MAFWRNLKGGLEEVKKKVGEKIKPYIPSVPSPHSGRACLKMTGILPRPPDLLPEHPACDRSMYPSLE